MLFIIRKFHSRSSDVPPIRFIEGKPAIFTNITPLGAFWCPFLFGKPINDRNKERGEMFRNRRRIVVETVARRAARRPGQ